MRIRGYESQKSLGGGDEATGKEWIKSFIFLLIHLLIYSALIYCILSPQPQGSQKPVPDIIYRLNSNVPLWSSGFSIEHVLCARQSTLIMKPFEPSIVIFTIQVGQ